VAALTFYFDRNVGRQLPEALKLLGLAVEHHGDHLDHDTPDDHWLAMAGQRGWIVVTHDRKFTLAGYEHEAAAVRQHNVGCFVLWGAEATRWRKMQCFARAYDSICEAAVSTPRPFIYDVARTGKLRRGAV